MNDFTLLINGKLVAGATTQPIVNPAIAEVFAEAPAASVAQLDESVAAASAAFPLWSRTPLEDRRAILNAIAERLEAHAEEIGQILTREQGKPIGEAIFEAQGAAYFFRYFAALELSDQSTEDGQGRMLEMHRRPFGVVAAIVPWNVPLILMAFKVPPALLAGNTVVLKPAPTTPLSTLHVGRLIADILPPGVLNILSDDGSLGAALVAHPGISKVSFTGSTETGKKVMAGASGTLKRVTLELGGNDAAIVLDDVDVDEIAPKLFRAAFHNSGQICVAVKRVYAHDDIYDALCDRLVALAEDAVVGNGLDPATQFGPLQNKIQYEKVKALIEDARGSGKVIEPRKAIPSRGYFIPPTIVRDIDDGARLVDEEQFGPVLPLVRISSEADAIARANASLYGLGASVWSSDKERALAIGRQLIAGTVWINKHGDLMAHIPFGGVGQSGIGTELGEHSLNEFTQLQVVNSTI